MQLLQALLFFAVSFGASVAGAVCGIGGGVIIKPVLDMFGWAGVSAVSFLSGCTVLSMSCYSVFRSALASDGRVEIKTGTPLAVGAALGGVAGKQLFTAVKAMFPNPNTVGAVQAVCLAVVTVGTLLYTLNKNRIMTHRVKKLPACAAIGLALGMLSSFLGIGGGPINLVVLCFFFSMDTKTAAANSLYIIFFSQTAGLIATLVTRTAPEVKLMTLALMVAGGILGGMAGRSLNKKIKNKTVDRLFVVIMALIILISAYNAVRYLS